MPGSEGSGDAAAASAGQGCRTDGRKLHPTYLFAVKSPAESRGPGDVYKVLATPRAERSFRPIAEGMCAMAKS